MSQEIDAEEAQRILAGDPVSEPIDYYPFRDPAVWEGLIDHLRMDKDLRAWYGTFLNIPLPGDE